MFGQDGIGDGADTQRTRFAMSRVEEAQTQSSREAERAANEADKRSREAKRDLADRQVFGKLLQGQKESKETQTQQTKSQGESKQAEGKQQAQQKGASDLARTAMAARQGSMQGSKLLEQARGFQGGLQQTQTKTGTENQGRVETRESAKARDRVDREDRAEVQTARAETKKERETELARTEARDAARPNAAIGSDSGKGQGDQQPQDDGSAAAAAAIKKAAQQPVAVQAPKAAQQVKQIPPELLEKLVSTVYLAVTEKGLKEFQIELKDGPLKGGFLKISADKGKVALSFSGLDPATRNLVESSKGDLMRRLEKKGLSLARLDVK